MFRKFLAAVILAVFMLNAQIAAAKDYDWSKAPRIGSKAELARYVESERQRGNTKIRVILINGLKIKDDFGYMIPCWDIKGAWYPNSYETMRIDYEIIEYPGTHVANAYLSREPHMAWKNLTAEEQKLYNIAVRIVDEAKKRPSEREKARYIHDVICDSVYRGKNENKNNETAIGALIDHYAQCEGYSDAFYMLGRMLGLNVGRIGGYINGNEGHAWNWITFRDGKSYCVDVTLDDTYNSYNWFLKTKPHMEKTHSCEWKIIPNLQ